jgi:hypothetical protein
VTLRSGSLNRDIPTLPPRAPRANAHADAHSLEPHMEITDSSIIRSIQRQEPANNSISNHPPTIRCPCRYEESYQEHRLQVL